jgi:hypothetical protein
MASLRIKNRFCYIMHHDAHCLAPAAATAAAAAAVGCRRSAITASAASRPDRNAPSSVAL